MWHFPYKPQFELYVGLPPISTVNESTVLLLEPLFPYCGGGPRSVDPLAAASTGGRVQVCGVTQKVTGLLNLLSATICRRETILIRASVRSVSLEVVTHQNEVC